MYIQEELRPQMKSFRLLAPFKSLDGRKRPQTTVNNFFFSCVMDSSMTLYGLFLCPVALLRAPVARADAAR